MPVINHEPQGQSKFGRLGERLKKKIGVDSKPKRAKTSYNISTDPATYQESSNGAATLLEKNGGLIAPKTWTVTHGQDHPRRSQDSAVAGATNPDSLHPAIASWKDTRGYGLAREITKVMMRNKIGLMGEYDWVPDEERTILITTSNIRKTLGPVSEDFAHWIEQKASKVFVITVLAISERDTRLAAMEAFFLYGFDDTHLPVKDMPTVCGHDWDASDRISSVAECGQHGLKEEGPSDESNLHCLYHSVWSSWSAMTFKTFYEKQWRLLLQRFDHKGDDGEDIFAYPDIEHDRILPLLPSREGTDKKAFRGNFGTVVPAQMLQSFQDTVEGKDGQTTIDVAIKTLTQQNDKTYDIEKEWHSEVAAHDQLGDLDREHLVKAIAAYRHRGEYRLLFEWADGGSLRSYWEDTDHSGLRADMIQEYLNELLGLTIALNTMHDTKRARSRSPSDRSRRSTVSRSSTRSSRHGPIIAPTDVGRPLSSTSGQNLNTEKRTEPFRSSEGQPPLSLQLPQVNIENFDAEQASPTRENENWRHGDIKPDNILRFTRERSALGTLKLADLGRAKQHFLATRNRPVLERDKWRTKPYEPPDLYIDTTRSMSRLFDVWSLGCVFFESIVWMLYGTQWLQSFAQTTTSANENETPFWVRSLDGDSASLSPIIKACISQILDKDPECSGSTSSAIKDLLLVVQSKMLVVDLPDKTEVYEFGKRANTENILISLRDIIQRSKNQPNYLFTGNDRSNLKHLPEPKKEVPSVAPDNAVPPQSKSSLSVPVSSRNRKSKTQLLNTYSGAPDNKWAYRDDEDFARSVYEQEPELYDAECLELKGQMPHICDGCQHLDFNTCGILMSRKMDEFDRSCYICNLLLDRASSSGLENAKCISLSRHDTGLAISSEEDALDRTAHWRLVRSIGEMQVSSEATSSFPPGLLNIPDVEGTATITLLRSWLTDCKSGHGDRQLECLPLQSRKIYPKRLLDVGIGRSAKLQVSHIIETGTLPKKGTRGINYMALSHPWGDNTEAEPHFVSDRDNIGEHMKDGIPDHRLPRNFQDAVTITRQLGIRYLWIDALCIIQASPSGDPGDFQEEAKSMQDIFSSAYCVLAASSASGMHSGFLRSGNQSPKSKHQAVKVNAGGPDDCVYMCDNPDDFQNDVINGSLSSRAWAFQERALARRTIFFTDNQIYWECSGGIRCESMSKLENSEAAFLGDSDFPAYVVKEKTKGAQIYLFKSLYTLYCGLTIRRKTDKPFAISGLEQRLTKTFGDTSGAGVFGRHKHRCLLWKKAENVESLERIDFPTAIKGTQNPPSWSFMAHIGRIEYIDVPGGSVEWAELDLQLTGSADISWINGDPLTFHAQAWEFEIGPRIGSQSGMIDYDNPSKVRANEKCVIIGDAGDAFHYVLVVRPKEDEGAGMSLTEYERCGAGYIPVGWIKRGRSVAVDIV